jgi:hypothetical protein
MHVGLKKKEKMRGLFGVVMIGLFFSGVSESATIEKYYRSYQSYSCTVIEIKQKDIQAKWALSNRAKQKEMKKQLKALHLLAKTCH